MNEDSNININTMTTDTTDEVEYTPHSCHHCQSTTISLSQVSDTWGQSAAQNTLNITCAKARHAAADGCAFFSFLTHSSPSEHEANDLRYSITYEHSSAQTSTIYFQYPAHSQVLEVYAGDAETVADFWSPPNLAPASPGAVTQAKKWLVECVTEHAKCAETDDDVFVPPRLLRVACSPDEVLLVHMDIDHPAPVQYAILSYCWGGDQTFKTTKSNVEKPSRAIQDLPQTIQDAILVTRQLGLEYLWIDSMCIIQDSPEDKAQLISQMHRIYACAHVTIAASSAEKCTEGFLAPRTSIPQFRMPMCWKSNGVERLGTVILTPSPQHSPPEPLTTRAWTLQESLLSRRLLSYGTRQLRWYCLCAEHSCGGVLDRSSTTYPSFQSLQESAIDYPARRLKSGLVSKPLTSLPWIPIIEQYTSRNISVPADKLVAISAVAQQLSNLTAGKWGMYHAGLWRERFCEQLLWNLSSREVAPRPTAYRAPSWSWASVDGRVKWAWIEHLVDAKISCEVLDVDVRPVRAGDVFGEIRSGRLRVKGGIKEAVWEEGWRGMRDTVSGESITDRRMECFADHEEEEEEKREIVVFVLEVATRSLRAGVLDKLGVRLRSHSGRYVAGLILKHLGNEIYERVGFIGMRSVKVDTTALKQDWSKVGNTEWWTEGFIKKIIDIV